MEPRRDEETTADEGRDRLSRRCFLGFLSGMPLLSKRSWVGGGASRRLVATLRLWNDSPQGGRGRDIGCPIPPAQIPTSGIPA